MTDSAPAPLPVRNQDGLVCWTKQARLIAQVLISAAVNWRAGQETRPYNVSGGSQQDGKTGGASPSPTGRWGSILRRRTRKTQHPAGLLKKGHGGA